MSAQKLKPAVSWTHGPPKPAFYLPFPFSLFPGSRINCNIFSYDYSGYGASSGKPSEKNLYSDIDAAWNNLRTKYGISPENIILYGQSIGTVPTIDLASR